MTDCRFPKKLEIPDMLCKLSSSVAKATDGGLKCFVSVSVKVNSLEATYVEVALELLESVGCWSCWS